MGSCCAITISYDMSILFMFLYCSAYFCRFFHYVDTFGDSVETQFHGKELAKAFDEFGELEGEMMDLIISAWKADPLMNHVFASGSRVLLSPNFLTVRKIELPFSYAISFVLR